LLIFGTVIVKYFNSCKKIFFEKKLKNNLYY
jgi:hypothetical protein